MAHAIVDLVESWRLAKMTAIPVALMTLLLLGYYGALWLKPDALPEVVRPPVLAEEVPHKEKPSPTRSNKPPVQKPGYADLPTIEKADQDEVSASSSPVISGSPSSSSSPSTSASGEPTEGGISDTPGGSNTAAPSPTAPSEHPVTETPEETPPTTPVTNPDMSSSPLSTDEAVATP